MVNWEQSYRYGARKEKAVLPLLHEYFGEGVTRNADRYAKYDYSDECCDYELKSRTNKMKQYPTTMLTRNKLEERDVSKDPILLFNFNDCLAYIQYEAEKFAEYDTRNFSRLGASWDEKPHLHIPIEHLQVIKTY